LLAHNCNVNLQNDHGVTALMSAIDKGQKDIVDMLLAHNCNLDVQSNEGGTALMCAASHGYKDIVVKLLGMKCNLDLQSTKGKDTALMMAADEGHEDVVDALIRHKCKLDLKDSNGFTALVCAKVRNHVGVVTLIENQLRRDRNWDQRKALMLVLLGSNYLPSSSSLIVPLSSPVDAGLVAQTPVVPEVADLTTSVEKVLHDMFLVQHIMRYI